MKLTSAASVRDAARDVLAAWDRVAETDDVAELRALGDAMERLRPAIGALRPIE